MDFKKKNKIARKESLEAANLARGGRATKEEELYAKGDKEHLLSEIDRRISSVEYDLIQYKENEQLIHKLEELKKERVDLVGSKKFVKKKVVELVYRSDDFNCRDYTGDYNLKKV